MAHYTILCTYPDGPRPPIPCENWHDASRRFDSLLTTIRRAGTSMTRMAIQRDGADTSRFWTPREYFAPDMHQRPPAMEPRELDPTEVP